MKKVLLLIVLMQFFTVAHARMYQWVDPDTGTTQLSGKPPPWYRSANSGPRVFVFENGRLIDDTGISLSEEDSERLRHTGLLKAEQDAQQAMAKLQQASQQKAILELQNREDEPIVSTLPAPTRQQSVEEPAPQEEINSGPTAEQLRALIEQYEQSRTEGARELIETVEP